MTAAVWRGGDRDAETSSGGGTRPADTQAERDDRLCRLLKCLLGSTHGIDTELEHRLRGLGLDLEQVRKCLAAWCTDGRDSRRGGLDG
ncbi:hypothetical protein OOT46_28420 [Aquabacterium sp. A7-Y]|uniref:hypothetical protein n=1 Tax=Aquabacterium sp. A7-Y TaxID=1349605 RepID=UPI00223C8DFE|nr:hypothetical protein [Aquabacterium sp. A7-Y]MCW7541727.1 hypothetical protein [Aquabacterium sp. A7-Y]